MSMPIREEDIGRMGRAIYKDKILNGLDETMDKGKVVVIDVNSGDHEVADDEMIASSRLRARVPDAITWAERVGYPTVYEMISIRLKEIPEL